MYVVAMRDFLKRPKIKPLDLFKYKGQIGDVIEYPRQRRYRIGRLGCEHRRPGWQPHRTWQSIETATGSGKWIYTATASVAYGSDVFIEVVGVDHAGNETKLTENPPSARTTNADCAQLLWSAAHQVGF